MNQTAVDILTRAKARIQDPANFCKGQLARDKHGRPTDADDQNAAKWCALGSNTEPSN